MVNIDKLVLILARGILETDYQLGLKKVVEIRGFMEGARLTQRGYNNYLKQLSFYENRLRLNRRVMDCEDGDLVITLAWVRVYQLVYFFQRF